jgi:hypothetical protein
MMRSARVTDDPGATSASLGYNGDLRTPSSTIGRTAMTEPRHDAELHHKIDELVAEEHRLERAHVGTRLSDDEQERLRDVGVQLDRLWDLLRQREARRNAGLDPDTAQDRGTGVVEGYIQ